jgi:hypothetical protein
MVTLCWFRCFYNVIGFQKKIKEGVNKKRMHPKMWFIAGAIEFEGKIVVGQ